MYRKLEVEYQTIDDGLWHVKVYCPYCDTLIEKEYIEFDEILKCPKCGTEFKIQPRFYAKIVSLDKNIKTPLTKEEINALNTLWNWIEGNGFIIVGCFETKNYIFMIPEGNEKLSKKIKELLEMMGFEV